MKSNCYKKLIASGILFAALTLPMLAQAKQVTMLQEPKVGAASSGTVDLSYGVIPIFTSKDGKWVKIGDPRNGNVGWVQASELSANNDTSVIFTNRISEGGNNTKSYVFQFGTPTKLNAEQEKVLQKLQAQQAASRKAMQKTMEDMMNNWNSMMMPGPILMPIIVVPQPEQPTVPAKVKS